jgi:hypothetical protein
MGVAAAGFFHQLGLALVILRSKAGLSARGALPSPLRGSC